MTSRLHRPALPHEEDQDRNLLFHTVCPLVPQRQKEIVSFLGIYGGPLPVSYLSNTPYHVGAPTYNLEITYHFELLDIAVSIWIPNKPSRHIRVVNFVETARQSFQKRCGTTLLVLDIEGACNNVSLNADCKNKGKNALNWLKMIKSRQTGCVWFGQIF